MLKELLSLSNPNRALELMEELDAVQGSDGGFRAPKLRALFAAEQQKLQVGNATFQYQPPKLPRQPPAASTGSTNLDPPSNASTLSSSKQIALYSVALSQVVYILPSGRQENYGSAGIAILEGDPHERQPPHVVLYSSSKSPESPLVDLSITDKIDLVPDIDCWVTLETKAQNSRLQFRSTDEWIGFARAFVCTRSHAHGTSSTITLQDVTVPKDSLRQIEDGDMVQLMYKMHLEKPWPSSAIGPLLRETSGNGLKLEIGSGLAPLGLEDGIKGMQKGGRRFVVLHEVSEQGLKDAVIVYDITVSRIRKRKLLKAGDGSLDMSAKHGNESDKNIGSVEDRETVYNTSTTSVAEGERNNESVLNRIARMSRAGAAVDLHLFGIPRATRLEDRPEISMKYSSNEVHTVQEKNVNVDSVGNEKLIGKNDDEADERGTFPELHTDLGLRKNSTVGSSDRAELLEDIKQSQTCIYTAVTELSSKIELLINTKSQKPEKLDLGALAFMDGDAQEDSLVESVARMIAENRELKRRLPETRSQNAARLSSNTEEIPQKGMEAMDSETSAGYEGVPEQHDVIEEPEQVPKQILDCNKMKQKMEQIMFGIHHDLGLELQEYLEPANRTKVLSSLHQKLTAATSATVDVIQEELAVFATANHSTVTQLLHEGYDPADEFEE